MTDKITSERLQRRAIVYVRQSSQQQLLHNTESRRLQYAMKERVLGLGWQDVEVIDEDQGRSATTTNGSDRSRSAPCWRAHERTRPRVTSKSLSRSDN